MLAREGSSRAIAASTASLLECSAKQPCRTKVLVERHHGGLSADVIKKIENGLGQMVGVDGTTRHTHDGEAGFALPGPAEIVGHSHYAATIPRRRSDAA